MWGLQALRGLEGDVRDHHRPGSPSSALGSYRATHHEETACEHLGEPNEHAGPGGHGNSVSPASLVPASSGCSETGAGVGAVGEALQGVPRVSRHPPPSILQPQASGALAPRSSGTSRGPSLPPGWGRAVGPMGGGCFQWGMGSSQLTPPCRVQSQSLQNPSVQQGQGVSEPARTPKERKEQWQNQDVRGEPCDGSQLRPENCIADTSLV